MPCDPRITLAPRFPDAIEVGFGDTIDTLLDRLTTIPGAPDRQTLVHRIQANHLGIDIFSLRVGMILELHEANLRAPNRKELLSSPIVRRAVEAAWIDSLPADAVGRHEEGGWIYLNTRSGVVFTHRALSGASNSIDLSSPILFVDAVVVGTFHTHPHPDGHQQGPSDSDEEMEHSRGVPGILRTHVGYIAYGPDRRASLHARTGFFPGTPQRPLD